jgi:NAD(P)H-nitrite reductase large subunit
MAESLTEDQCVKLVKNFLALIHERGKYEERSAGLIKRLGKEEVRCELNKGLEEEISYTPYLCDTKLNKN